MTVARPGWELPPRLLSVAATAPIGATVATWAWLHLMNLIAPDWHVRACMGLPPSPPWAAAGVPDLILGAIILGWITLTGILVRRGHAWLAALFLLYYFAVLFVGAMGSLMITGVCK